MKKIKIHIWRRAIQTGVAGLFVTLPMLNQAGFNFIWGNFLNVHVGCLTFSDPLAVSQIILKNHYLPIGLLIGAGMVLAISFFLGTIFCSWICPFGLLSELVNSFSSRVWPKKFSNRKTQEKSFAVKAAVFCTGFLVFWAFFRTPILNQVSMPFQYFNIFLCKKPWPLLFGLWVPFCWWNFYFKPACGVVGFVRSLFFWPLSSGSILLDLQLFLTKKTVSQTRHHSPASRPVPWSWTPNA